MKITPIRSMSPLEEAFQEIAFPESLAIEDTPFEDYLIPNENWEGAMDLLQPHLDPKDYPKHLLIATGTERALMDLLLSGERAGLVVMDINPRVKAYLDMNTLLMQIASSREDFLDLIKIPATVADRPNPRCEAAHVDSDDVFDKLDQIEERISKSDLPDPLKEYYLSHLDDLALFYSYKPDFLAYPGGYIPYHEEDAAFTKLQTYAKAGKIIAIVADINAPPPSLLKWPVKELDISNIGTYCLVRQSIACERIIWTKVAEKRPLSWPVSRINESDSKEIDKLFQARFGKESTKTLSMLQVARMKHLPPSTPIDPCNTCPPTLYSPQLLSLLKKLP